MERLEKIISKRLQKDPEEKIFWWRDEWWGNKDFLDLVQTCSERLSASGFSSGDRLAVLLPNSPMVLALSLAVWEKGGTVSTLNARAGSASLAKTLELIDPQGVIISEDMTELGESLASSGFMVIFSAWDKPFPVYKGVEGKNKSDPSLAIIFATSGTTGLPKAVPLYHSNLTDNAVTVFNSIEEMEEGDVLLNVLPNFHSFGYTVSGILPLICGMHQVLLPSFMPPSKTIETINKTGVTSLIVVPAMLSFMLGTIKNTGVCLDKPLKLIVTGGDRLNVQLDDKVRENMGVGVLEGYGLTECSPVVCVNRSYASRKLGTVGQLIPGYSKQIRDLSGKLLPDGQDGVMWVKGPSVGGEYFRAPELTEERFQDGWFNTGDVVNFDDEGYVTILDRATDIIIVGGFNVYPQEVEAVLNGIEGVSAAVAIGMPHPVNGEVVKAFIMREEGSSVKERDIISYCKNELAHFKVPRKVEFLDSFPLSATGKILRRKLREKI